MNGETRPKVVRPRSPRQDGLVRVAMIIGIAILLNVFLAYLVRVFYHAPEFTDFCPEKPVVEQLTDRSACLGAGGQWNELDPAEAVSAGFPAGISGYCDERFACSKDFESATALYNRNLFVVFIVAGAMLLLGSPFLSGVGAISSGLSLGGVIALIFGSMRYWSAMDDRLRVAVSGIALIALIVIAWKKFKDIEL